ncbi:MAG: methylenetetrahydrofolate reductase [Christensenellaceae bacterium]|jgi:methylenetetrahydrofolate reductase (NADPH)|nr:methylenetetrahydrofolate reductase [Christensenellaceae bacterium]
MIDFNSKQTLFSLELFPPKDTESMVSIYASMGRFKAFKPDYISVTYGAGGSDNHETVSIASDIKNKFGIESVAHLTCLGSTRENIDSALLALKAGGIKNILALRGDKSSGNSDFKYATDLIAHIKKYGGFDVCAACYPEGHKESLNKERDFDILKLKADLGVTHFISQLFFDTNDFEEMLEGMAKRNINVPTEAGIMPVVSAKQIMKMVMLSGARIPEKLEKCIKRFESNKEAMKAAGINYAVNLITELLAINVAGIHLYAMNNPDTTELIYKAISPMLNKTI